MAKTRVLRRKVYAYITHSGRLLGFRHPYAPEAGIQVPGGTLREGEDPVVGVVRESHEETGLSGLVLGGFLGERDHSAPERNEVHRRRFYHLARAHQPPERWRTMETDPSDGSPERPVFEFYWVRLPDEVPPLAPGHDCLLPELVARLLGVAEAQ